MIFPLNANKIEQLDVDPSKKIDGYIWYNRVDKVYKTWVGDQLHIFITDKSFESSDGGIIQTALAQHQFTITFSEAYRVVIKHNKNSLFFNYNVYDTEENCSLPCSLEIMNENEVSVDFVEPVTGYIFMYFE